MGAKEAAGARQGGGDGERGSTGVVQVVLGVSVKAVQGPFQAGASLIGQKPTLGSRATTEHRRKDGLCVL